MSDEQGWVTLHRKLLNNPFLRKPNYLAIWVYILLRCNHKPNEIVINDEKVMIYRGQFLGSLKKISEHFRIPYSSVSKVVNCLERDQMVITTRTKNYTLFQVVNYDLYQSGDIEGDNDAITACYQRDTNNNDNNDNTTPYSPPRGDVISEDVNKKNNSQPKSKGKQNAKSKRKSIQDKKRDATIRALKKYGIEEEDFDNHTIGQSEL